MGLRSRLLQSTVLMPAVLALGMLRQDCLKFEISVGSLTMVSKTNKKEG